MQPMINLAGPDCVCLITQARTVTLRTGIDAAYRLNRAPQSGVLHASSSPSLSANMYNISLQSTAIHQYVNTISTISEPPPSTIRTPTSHPSLPRRVIHSTTCDTISLMSNPPPCFVASYGGDDGGALCLEFALIKQTVVPQRPQHPQPFFGTRRSRILAFTRAPGLASVPAHTLRAYVI